MTALLAIENLRFGWRPAQPVLDIPALHLAAGERLFLAGPSGCGKTSLLSLIAGTARADSGDIHLDGQPLHKLRPAARDRLRADRIGILFQLFNLLPYLSVRDNVLLSAHFSRLREQRARERSGSAEAEAERLLKRLGLPDELLARPARELSIGQQQRVAAARALFGNPALIIADEPTSALDSQHRDRFIELLMEECATTGSALLFVSHDTALARHFDRRIDLPTLNRLATPERLP